jgi:hypothetical protein
MDEAAASAYRDSFPLIWQLGPVVVDEVLPAVQIRFR